MRFEDHIAALGGAVDRILDDLPDTLLGVRRKIESELKLEISAEELQTIVRVAEEQSDQPLLRDLPRRLLTLRVLAERQLDVFWESSGCDADAIQESADDLERSLAALERIDLGFQSVLGTERLLTDIERKFLERVLRSFVIPRESLSIAILIAPRLVDLIRTGHPESERTTLEARTLQLLVEDDLMAWFQADSAATGHTQLIARLEQELHAVDFVSGRLDWRAQQARRENQAELAARLDERRQDLELLEHELTPIVRQDGEPEAEPDEAEQTARLLAEAEALDQAADLEATDELERLREIKVTRTVKTEKARVRRKGRKRRVLLHTVAAICLIAAARFHMGRERGPRPISVSTLDFSQALLLSEVRAVGTMLYARSTFDDFGDRDELLASMSRVGRIALDMGFQQVYLVDPNGEPVATWIRGKGPEIRRRLTGSES